MSIKGFKKPFPGEEGFEKKILKTCPFCGKNMGKGELAKLKATGSCKCNKCGKTVFNGIKVWKDGEIRW